MDCVQTQGKQNKKVTTLLLDEMVQALDALVAMREPCGILAANKFLFANSSLTHLPSWDTMTSLAKDAGCVNPMSVTSTRLRKYLATIFQVCIFIYKYAVLKECIYIYQNIL